MNGFKGEKTARRTLEIMAGRPEKRLGKTPAGGGGLPQSGVDGKRWIPASAGMTHVKYIIAFPEIRRRPGGIEAVKLYRNQTGFTFHGGGSKIMTWTPLTA